MNGLLIDDGTWRRALDGDPEGLAIYKRHYSARRYADGRRRRLFVGPGEKLVLVAHDGRALFIWRRFVDDSGQEGVNCAAFRNEGSGLSSTLITQAMAIAWARWPAERLYTYVDAGAVRSSNPGYCFLAAGWRHVGWTKGGHGRRSLRILEARLGMVRPGGRGVSIVFADDWLTVRHGDARSELVALPSASIDCVVTSPPYWGLRDYGVPGQIGLEPSPDQYVAELVAVFREVWRVLRPAGTVWLNLGDTYATGAGRVGTEPGGGEQGARWVGQHPSRMEHRGITRPGAVVGPMIQPNRLPVAGLKPKDRVMIPARVAMALQADGWWLRDEIVWVKPNPMPSSVTDRTTPAHEMVYLLTRSRRYYYDAAAIRERAIGPDDERNRFGARIDVGLPGKQPDRRRNGRRVKVPGGWDVTSGAGGHGSIHREGRTEATYAGGGADGQRRMRDRTLAARADGAPHDDPFGNGRNKRSVWTVASHPYPEAHFATFPPKLIEPMILAGCPDGGVVLDPFAGSGTTGLVAQRLGRRAVLIDLSLDYLDQALRRNAQIPLAMRAEATA